MPTPTDPLNVGIAGALANTKTMTSEEVEVTFAAHLLFGAMALGGIRR